MRIVIALFALLAVAADKPKISNVSAVKPPERKEEAPKSLSIAARCTSCTEAISGKLTVTATRVSFCCNSWRKGDAGAKASAVCPWSFDVAASEVETQYLDTTDGVWHLVTKEGVDYAFAGEKEKAMQEAFEMLRAAQPDLPAKKLVEKFASKVADVRAPQLAERDCRE